MKKKQLSPIAFLAFILLICMLLTIIGNHVGEQKPTPLEADSDSRVTLNESETNDIMFWESVSYHLLMFAR